MTDMDFSMREDAKRRFRSGQPLVWLACLLLGAGLLLLAANEALSEPEPRQKALMLTIEGSIGPATLDYLERGMAEARDLDARLIIIKLDTPGGLATSMRSIIKTILGSQIPIATYVAPSGARAASAGTYLLYASHIAAMAPATNLGSATPVQMGGFPGSPEPEKDAPGTEEPEDDAEGKQQDNAGDVRRGETAMERKVLEDAVAYIRSLAERYGRNADWAEKAVREGANLPAREAAERNVIDLIASDVEALLREIDGRTVTMSEGEVTLETAELELARFDPDWRTDLLSIITNPNIAYFLMIIGFYGLIFELANPGAMVPGVIGAISLILALFAFQVLSVNYAGLALVLLGLAFIVGEAFIESFGALGIGGIIAFVVGSVIMMDGTNQHISWPLIGGTAAVAAGFMLWTVLHLIGFRKKQPHTGQSELMGTTARVVGAFHDAEGKAGYRGKVYVHGETWSATSDTAFRIGDRVKITRIQGLEVRVVPLGQE